MGTLVGVRELKNRLSRYLQEAKQGRSITVTERGKPVAILGPTSESPDAKVVRELVRESLGTWEGGKPKGAPHPPAVKGKPVSKIVLEERR